MNAPIDHSNDRDRDRARGDASRPRWANDEEWRAAEAVPFIPSLPIDEAREAEHLDRLAAELAASAAAQFTASVTTSRQVELRQPEAGQPERALQPEPRSQPEARSQPRFESPAPRFESPLARRESHGEPRTVLRQETHAEFRSVLRQEAHAEFRPDAQDAIPTWMQKPHALQPAVQTLPPIEQPSRFRFGYAARAFVLAMSAAGGAYFLVYGLPEPLRQMFGERAASSAPGESSGSKTGRLAVGKLVVSDIRGMVGDWIPLNMSVDGQMKDGDAIITGFAPGTTLSMGEGYGSGGWRVTLADLPKLQAHLPQNYSGSMELVVELRGGDAKVVDRKAIRFDAANPRLALASMGRPQQPAPPQGIGPVSTPAPGRAEETAVAALPRNHTNQAADEVNTRARQMDPAEAAVMLKRGEELAKTGDLAAARLLLQRAAEANHAGAAFALAATYDPIVLKQLAVLGMSGDIAVARQWYERARELGIREATARLEALARWGR
jgi:hypothetical protein